MKLGQYLAEHGLTLEAFAGRIGVSTGAACRYAHGHRIPRRAIMARIVEATGGAVGPTDFYENAEGEAA